MPLDRPCHSELCRGEWKVVREAAIEANGEPLVIGCSQERPLFEDILDTVEGPVDARFVELRETAGWSDEAAQAGRKIDALLAEAAVKVAQRALQRLEGDGSVIILGEDDTALEAAHSLAAHHRVNVVLSSLLAPLTPPAVTAFAIVKGTRIKVSGHFGAFTVQVDDALPPAPSSKGELLFDGHGKSMCYESSLILDLRRGTPLFRHREGYFHAEPDHRVAVAQALTALARLPMTLEKPHFIDFDHRLCAHRRAGSLGCRRCLDVCPTGALTAGGETATHIDYDSTLCAGCGGCLAQCPTGAISDGDAAIPQRLSAMLSAHGPGAVVLFHDDAGKEIIADTARHGRGLPARIVPFRLNEIASLDVKTVLQAFIRGAQQVLVLGEAAVVPLAQAIIGDSKRVSVVSDDFYAVPDLAAPLVAPAVPSSSVHEMTKQLRPDTNVIGLPAQAPYGPVEMTAGACTLCMGCVQTCPQGALRSDEQQSSVIFHESACIHCGICVAVCPTNALALGQPRLKLDGEAVVLKEEEGFACVRCGKVFAPKATVDHMLELLQDNPMYQGPGLERLKMCEDCRVVDLHEQDS